MYMYPYIPTHLLFIIIHIQFTIKSRYHSFKSDPVLCFSTLSHSLRLTGGWNMSPARTTAITITNYELTTKTHGPEHDRPL